MNLLSIFTLLLFLSTLVQADYIRSIRIGSFPTESDALAFLGKIDKFVSKHQNLKKLENERSFRFKARASGKYYVTVAEPFTDRKVLQEVLDTLRLEYRDAYVTKLHKIPTMKKIPPIDETILEEKIIENKKVPHIKKEFQKKVEESRVQKVPKQVQIINKKEKQETKISYVYFFIALIITLVIFLFVAIVILLKYKRKNEHYINQEMIDPKKLTKLYQELQMKDKLLSRVNYEFRTPIIAIIGLTHLVLESELSKLQKDYILKIDSFSQHLLNSVNDLLGISKMQAGKPQIEKVEFNINDILEYILNVNAMGAKTNGTSLTLHVALDIPSKVVGDPLRLSQVLMNLVGNAIRFTKNGEVSLEVKKFLSITDGVKLVFIVSDTGIGMTQEQVDNIFNSYYQANDDTSGKYGETGVGLTFSKELVEMMGGEFKVSSTKYVGTTFSFTVSFQLKDA